MSFLGGKRKDNEDIDMNENPFTGLTAVLDEYLKSVRANPEKLNELAEKFSEKLNDMGLKAPDFGLPLQDEPENIRNFRALLEGEHDAYHILGEAENTYKARSFSVTAIEFTGTNTSAVVLFCLLHKIPLAVRANGQIFIGAPESVSCSPAELEAGTFVVVRGVDEYYLKASHTLMSCTAFQMQFKIPASAEDSPAVGGIDFVQRDEFNAEQEAEQLAEDDDMYFFGQELTDELSAEDESEDDDTESDRIVAERLASRNKH